MLFCHYFMDNKHNTAIPMMDIIVHTTGEKTVIQRQESTALTIKVNIVFH